MRSFWNDLFYFTAKGDVVGMTHVKGWDLFDFFQIAAKHYKEAIENGRTKSDSIGTGARATEGATRKP